MYGGFGRRFGNPWSEGDWEGWTPPWMQGEGYGPRGPRGPFGPGRGFFGPRGPFGPGPRFFGPRGPFGPGWWGRQQWGSPELQALMSEAAEVARLFAIASQGALENRERLAQLRALLERSRKELSDMIYGTGQTGSTGSAPDVGQA